MDDAGLSYLGSTNWVSGISAPEVLGVYMLQERQNSNNSGWMYTVNGSHVNKTMDKYELRDNDNIVWHYINDYAYEQEDWATGSDGDGTLWNLWLKAPDRNPGESDQGNSGNTDNKMDNDQITTVTPAAPADKNGEAAMEVDSAAIKDAVNDAKKNGASSIVIELELKGGMSKVTSAFPHPPRPPWQGYQGRPDHKDRYGQH